MFNFSKNDFQRFSLENEKIIQFFYKKDPSLNTINLKLDYINMKILKKSCLKVNLYRNVNLLIKIFFILNKNCFCKIIYLYHVKIRIFIKNNQNYTYNTLNNLSNWIKNRYNPIFEKSPLYNYMITNTFVKKHTYRDFFKLKVQKKYHVFYKNVINVEFFNKKLLNKKINYELTYNNNLSLFNKLQFLINFLCLTLNKKYIYFKKNKNIYFFYKQSLFFTRVEFNFTLKKFFLKKKLYNYSIFMYSERKVFVGLQHDRTLMVDKIYIFNLKKSISNNNVSIFSHMSNKTFLSEFSNFFNKKTGNSYNYLPNSNLIFNNFFPQHNLSIKTQFLKNVLLRNNLNPSFIVYYNYYLSNFLEIFLEKKLWFKVNTNSTALINNNTANFIQKLFIKNKSDQFSLGRHFYLLEFLEILFISFFYRDLKFFSYWVKKTMEKIHLKKHKKFLKVIHNTLKNNQEFLILLKIQGFTMDVRGKLGTTGNSKKKHYAFTVGTMSPTSKNHDMSLNQTTVRTSTGVLGVLMTLSY